VGSLTGCCDKSVQARAFIAQNGNSCDSAFKADAPQVSYLCPGSEATVCWQSDDSNVKVTVSPDPGALSGTYPGHSSLTFTPKDNTTVTIEATSVDCAKAIEQIGVVGSQGVTGEFYGHWDQACSRIEFQADPNFFDNKIAARDIFVPWTPTVDHADGSGEEVCPTPPFLRENHGAFGVEISQPLITTTFPNLEKLVGAWDSHLETCGTFTSCYVASAYEFDMTLVCPGQ